MVDVAQTRVDNLPPAVDCAMSKVLLYLVFPLMLQRSIC